MTKDNDLLKELEEDDAVTPYAVKKAEKSEAEKEYDERMETRNTISAEPIEELPKSNKDSMSDQRAYFKAQNEPEPEVTKKVTVPVKKSEPTVEANPDPEPDTPLPPTPLDDDLNGRIKELEKIVKDIVTAMFRKDEQIEILTKANIELILIDMQTIADDLNRADELTGDTGTEEQIENIHYEKDHRGPNMALAAAIRCVEHDGSNAKKIEHVHEALGMALNKLNEKLKYIAEA